MAHNRLLHEAFAQSQYTRAELGHSGEGLSVRGGNSANAAVDATAEKQLPRNSHVSIQEDTNEVLLPTTMLRVQAMNGSYCILRALLDQGSQTSIITEHAAQALKIPRQRCKGAIRESAIRKAIVRVWSH
ncbi:unnamed protein product [Colias eurytheme]|nr:unnamed protein product [Colias eurytheme]